MMERQARAHFLVFRVNRLVLALVLLAGLALLLFPSRGFLPAAVDLEHQPIRQGVTMLNRDFSGRTESEARSILTQMEVSLQTPPVPALETQDQTGVSYVIPELNGYALDVESTLFRLSVAPEGSRVEPATRINSPGKTLRDFPAGVIRRGNGDKPAVALLINVDWGTKELVEMLPVLKKRGARVTFFMSGRWADQHRQLVKTIAEDGHEVASHGYDLTSGPAALAQRGELRGDIERSVQVIERAAGRPVRYYAPHMSEINREIVKTAADLNLRTVLYSLDTIDWMESTTAEAILRTVGRAKAGDLILLHPKPATAAVLDRMVLDLQARELMPMTLHELISPDPGAPAGAFKSTYE